MITEVTGSKSHVDVAFMGMFMESRTLCGEPEVLRVPHTTVDTRPNERGIVEIPSNPHTPKIDSFTLRESRE